MAAETDYIQGQKDTSIRLVCELRAPGQVWFDQIALSESKVCIKPLEIILDPPVAYRNGIYSTMARTDQLTGEIRLNLPGVQELRLALAGVQAVRQVKSNRVAFSLPPPVAAGEHPLTVTALAADRKVLGTASLNVTVYPPAGREVTFRGDHVMLVNGQPFFPLGVWGRMVTGRWKRKRRLLPTPDSKSG